MGTQTAWLVGCWSRNQPGQQEAASAGRENTRKRTGFSLLSFPSLSPLLGGSLDVVKRGVNASEGRDS